MKRFLVLIFAGAFFVLTDLLPMRVGDSSSFIHPLLDEIYAGKKPYNVIDEQSRENILHCFCREIAGAINNNSKRQVSKLYAMLGVFLQRYNSSEIINNPDIKGRKPIYLFIIKSKELRRGLKDDFLLVIDVFKEYGAEFDVSFVKKIKEGSDCNVFLDEVLQIVSPKVPLNVSPKKHKGCLPCVLV